MVYEEVISKIALTILELFSSNPEVIQALTNLLSSSQNIFIQRLRNLDFNTAIEPLKSYIFLDMPLKQETEKNLKEEDFESTEEIANLFKELSNIDTDDSHQFQVIFRLEKIVTGNSEALPAVINVIKKFLFSNLEIDRYPLFKALEYVQRIRVINSEAIRVLTEVVHSNFDIGIIMNAVWALTAIGVGNHDVSNTLLDLVHDQNNPTIRLNTLGSLKNILQGELFSLAVVNLRGYLQYPSSRDNRSLYMACYEVGWHCAQNMPYPSFYHTWHQ